MTYQYDIRIDTLFVSILYMDVYGHFCFQRSPAHPYPILSLFAHIAHSFQQQFSNASCGHGEIKWLNMHHHHGHRLKDGFPI